MSKDAYELSAVLLGVLILVTFSCARATPRPNGAQAAIPATANTLDHKADSEAQFVQIITEREQTLGEDHPDTLLARVQLAMFLRNVRSEDAEAVFLGVIADMRRLLGADHPKTLDTMANLAGLYWTKQGRFEEAETLYAEALAGLRRVLGPQHPDTVAAMRHMASMYRQSDRYAESEALYLEALANQRRIDINSRMMRIPLSQLANLYERQGLYDKAEPVLRELLMLSERNLPSDHKEISKTRKRLETAIAEQQKRE